MVRRCVFLIVGVGVNSSLLAAIRNERLMGGAIREGFRVVWGECFVPEWYTSHNRWWDINLRNMSWIYLNALFQTLLFLENNISTVYRFLRFQSNVLRRSTH